MKGWFDFEWRKVWLHNRRYVQVTGIMGGVLCAEYFYGHTAVINGMLSKFEVGGGGLDGVTPIWMNRGQEGFGVVCRNDNHTGEVSNGGKGVLYVKAKESTPFLPVLADALGYRQPALDVFGSIGRLFGREKEDPAVFLTWPAFRKRLDRCARRYLEKHRHGVVLVIDEADLIEEPLLKELGSFAKQTSDEGLMRIVFITKGQDGRAFQVLQNSPCWNRAKLYN